MHDEQVSFIVVKIKMIFCVRIAICSCCTKYPSSRGIFCNTPWQVFAPICYVQCTMYIGLLLMRDTKCLQVKHCFILWNQLFSIVSYTDKGFFYQ